MEDGGEGFTGAKQAIPDDEGGGLFEMITFGLLSYPFFLLYGYHPVAVGSMSLPLSVIASGLVMICWYLFMGGYISLRADLSEAGRLVWFEAALLMLFICSLGAWGVAVIQVMGVTNPLPAKALTHFFLACFTEGWVVLAVLALLDNALSMDRSSYVFSPGVLAAIVVMAAPLTFPYGIAESMLTPLMLYTARAGGMAVAVAICLAGYSMFRSTRGSGSIWLWPLIFIMGKAVMQLTASLLPSVLWLSDPGLRVFYLHVLLLGAMTLAGVAYFQIFKNKEQQSLTPLGFSVLAVMVSLLMLTRIWPPAWSGMWVYYTVAGAAVLPVYAVAEEWYTLGRSG